MQPPRGEELFTPLYFQGQAPPTTTLLGNIIPAKSKGAASSKVADIIVLDFNLSITYTIFGNSTGGLPAPESLDSPTKYFLRVVLLVSLFPIRS